MIGRFDWNREFPEWARQQLAKKRTKLEEDTHPEITTALRAEIKLLKAILALPDRDPREGITAPPEEF